MVRRRRAAWITLSAGALALPSALGVWILPTTYLVLQLAGQIAILLLLGRAARSMPPIAPSERRGTLPPRSVSVIVPARNERADIERCLDDLRAQDWTALGGAMEVIVVDGGSEDGTAEIARSHPLHPLVLDEPPLPPAWVGKVWACHQGSLRSKGDLLLFLDADVRLAPETVRTAVETQAATQAELVTFAAPIIMEGFWERLVMPFFVQFVLLYFQLVRVDGRSTGPDMANGQFLLFSRDGYRKAGGHERVRGALLEDVRLAQEVRRSGGKVRMYTATHLVTTRMYAARSEMSEGIRKSLHGTTLSAGARAVAALLLGLLFLLPFLLLLLPILGLLPLAWALLSLVIIGVTTLKQVGLQRPFGAPAAYGLLYPLGVAYFVGLILRTVTARRSGGKVLWKGRAYPEEA